MATGAERLGAREVVRLVNGDASKEHIVAAWDELVAKPKRATPSSSVMPAMAVRSPSRRAATTRPTALNENFLLGGYQPRAGHARAHPRRRDLRVDEEADDKKVKVIFVADSCHSGGMERSAAAPACKFRKGNFAGHRRRPIARRAPEEFAKIGETDFNNVTFVGAVAEDKLTPEVTIEGKKRGALSWAFARALEGRADKDGDGAIERVRAARLYRAGGACAGGEPADAASPAAAGALGGARYASRRRRQAPAPADAATISSSRSRSKAARRPFGELPLCHLVADKNDADLIWSLASGKVEHVVGGVVAENVDAQRSRASSPNGRR